MKHIEIDSCVAIIRKGDTILMLKRHPHDRTLPDVYCLAGGKKDGNETDIECLNREVYEETNLVIDYADYEGKELFVKDSPCGKERKVYTMNFYDCYVKGTEVKISDEHESFVWLPIKDIPTTNIGAITKEFLLNHFKFW